MPRLFSRRSVRKLSAPSGHHQENNKDQTSQEKSSYQTNHSVVPNLNSHSEGLSSHVKDNIRKIMDLLESPDDLLVRTVPLQQSDLECAVICMAGLSDQQMINEQIIYPVQQFFRTDPRSRSISNEDMFNYIESDTLSVHALQRTESFEELVQAVLSGNTVLILDGSHEALLVGTEKWIGRSVEEPQTESLVRGPREGFNESISTNIILIRKQIRDPHLRFVNYMVGRRSKKKLSITYIDGIVDPAVVEEVKRRISSIDIDEVQESGIIEQWIEDSFLSPFPQILHTERPDKVAAALIQGKVAILLDGTPFALTLPITFGALIQSPEDYYERWLIGSLIRLLRFFAVGISLFLPALYIALLSYHQGMIPPKLAFSIAAAREGVPFPAVVEAFLMEITLELLREAGIRLPKPIGQTVGIVGGLVIGEAAVQAGIVSPIMVIVVSVTAIASFAIPSYSAGIAFRMLRFTLMIAASILGLYGIILAFIMISVHLSRLQSFGIPYISPIAPFNKADWKDLFIRAPYLMMTKRPTYLNPRDTKRIRNEEGGGS